METTKKIRTLGELIITALTLSLILLVFIHTVMAVDPTGATVTNYSTSWKNASSPSNRTDSKGTITTVVLDGMQQNTKWKAYVGNVSATFTLDDSADYTIYRWTVTSFTGNVYVSRNSSITWSTINCTNATEKENEGYSMNHSATGQDGLNITFNNQKHKSFYVGTKYISNSSCYSIATYINDTQQTLSEDSFFQEILLSDDSGRFVYTTFVEEDIYGYRNGSTYDFQVIVAEDPRGSVDNTPYFFYVELTAS